MKKAYIVGGSLNPIPGNNTKLIKTIADALKPYFDVKYIDPFAFSNKCKIVTRVASSVFDRNGYSDLDVMIPFSCELRKLINRDDPSVIIATCEPYASALSVALIKNRYKVLYLMDPPEIVICGESTKFRKRHIERLLSGFDLILTTPFIKSALIEKGFDKFVDKIVTVGFPLIRGVAFNAKRRNDNGKISLLFCGWLYQKIRSPEYFIRIINRLDERFSVSFIGKECEKITEHYNFDTKASVRALPMQEYSVAIQAMTEADILINIGNSIPVHMPSKTLEYINTGKPIVNFYKFANCPTLYYTKRYPLCLDIYEQSEDDVDNVTKLFVQFCEQGKGKLADRQTIEKEFKDCTPEYIAKIIIDYYNNCFTTD